MKIAGNNGISAPDAVASAWSHPVLMLAVSIAIAVSAIAVYSPSFNSPFIFDDEFSIVKNSSIRSIRPYDALFSQPGSGNPVQGRPVLNLTFAINYALGGLNVSGYHVFNLAIHILAALLLLGVVRRTLLCRVVSPGIRRSSAGIAFATALLWAIHPLATGAVTYISQRSESLASMLYLLTLYCVIRGAAVRGYTAVGWGVGAVAACALGMATKETLASAPLVVLLYDGMFLSSGFRDALRRRWTLYGALMATWVILATLVAGSGWRGGTAGFVAGATPLSYAATQLWAVVHYLRLSFWPDPLILDYGTRLATAGQIVPATIIVVLLFFAALIAFRRHRTLVFAVIFAAAVLAPSSSIIPVMTQTVAEHRMYLPLAAVILLTVLAIHRASDLLLAKGRTPLPSLVTIVRCMALVVIATALGAATLHRNRDYGSELTIWSDTFAKRPHNVRAAVYLGASLMNQNSGNAPDSAMVQALERFRDAIAIDSTYGLAFANRGLAYYRMKRFDEALRDYDKAIAVQSSQQGNRAELFNNRGILLGESGRTADAVADFRAAVSLMPDFSSAHSNLGSAYTILATMHAGQGDTALAAEEYQQSIARYTDAIRYDPKSIPAYRGRASTRGILGRFADAAEDCSSIIRLDPADAVAYADRAICYYQTGRYREAWQDVQECRKRGGMPNTELILALAKVTGQSK